MRFIWEVPNSLGSMIAALSVITLIFAIFFFVIFKVIHRRIPLIIYCASVVLIYASYLMCLDVVLYVSLAIFTVNIILTFFTNLGDLRKFLANPFEVKQAKNAGFKVEKIFDRDALYTEVEKAVLSFSKQQIGAIITFEKGTSLNDIMKNGVPIMAPVSAELLETIFYPGTRLHDGAVVIHGNEIVAASVFFTPTTKAFAGKYGSRHRAAIGISEISDAVTVVVSEETGRISFAVNGTLEPVDQTNFLRVLDNLLNDTKL